MTLFSSLQITTTTTATVSFLHQSSSSSFHSHNPSSTIFYKSLLPGFATSPSFSFKKTRKLATTRASLLETPVLWVGRICIYYALVKTGFVGSPSNPILSGLEIGDAGDSSESGGDLGFSKWTQVILGKPAKEGANVGNLKSKWHPTTKGTLRRNYRVPSKSEGRRLLKAIASLLSDDDHFVDATSHKGCQIRRESAHGESVCCNNVRALFDELPTPHLIVEITPFPAGPLSDKDYTKAEKLERVLRSSPSV
ncbi:hypothetical protein MtrunA17_Chr3g0121111 [Medicago truncatula]|uniref:Uncharacterized protein n=1 Tax=Medicago truncatula TaxID=3880 RepID=G7J9K0_MEDTR|nr:uncharacterized protein LOC11438506 [Medicago truncatula]AES71839.1 hypothetical protein MTR_3g083310 [Medicago truncatula]RHN69103.1 hypothetical protein MtrunA17_Chr3g0121111 [Medicago truncatula]